jgi:hypothetical protein
MHSPPIHLRIQQCWRTSLIHEHTGLSDEYRRLLVQVEIRRGFFENESVEVGEVEITIFSSVVEIPLVCIAYVCHTAMCLQTHLSFGGAVARVKLLESIVSYSNPFIDALLWSWSGRA